MSQFPEYLDFGEHLPIELFVLSVNNSNIVSHDRESRLGHVLSICNNWPWVQYVPLVLAQENRKKWYVANVHDEILRYIDVSRVKGLISFVDYVTHQIFSEHSVFIR